MKLYTVDEQYVCTLHQADNEVFYNTSGYDRKPYVGIIVFSGGYNYFIPLTSSKPKHKFWKNSSDHNYLIYEFVDVSRMTSNSIFVPQKNSTKVKHIMAVLEIAKMIPVPSGLFHEIDINQIADPVYKEVLTKEFNFLNHIFSDIQKKATNIYDFQKNTGKIFKYFCDFNKLEKICDTYCSK